MVLEKSKKPLYLVHFDGNYYALMRMERLFQLWKRTIAQNELNTILLTLVQKKFQNFVPKIQKNQFFELKNDQKIENFRKFFEKNFLIGND